MLRELTVRNLYLMETVDLETNNGFISITGETGAGKSTLLSALRLVLGSRADADAAHDGETASVAAVFDLDSYPDVLATLKQEAEELGLTLDDGQIILRRTLKDGKSKSYLQDQPVSLPFLKKVGELLCEWHGQYDNILQPEQQKILLDNWVQKLSPESHDLLASIESAYKNLQEIQQKITHYQARQKEKQQKATYAEAILRDLDPIAPQEGEEAATLSELDELKQWGKVKDHIIQASEQLPQATKPLYALINSLGRVLDADDARLKSLEQAALDIEDVQLQFEEEFERQRSATDRLDELENRLSQLRHTAIKWGVLPDELYQLWQDAKNFSADDTNLDDLHQNLKEHEKAYDDVASQMHDLRTQAAVELEKHILSELKDLYLDQTKIRIQVEQAERKTDGYDHVVFNISFNPGQPLAPIQKVASGGERARFMLVMRILLGKSRPVLVFDEVDQGVSGATAHAMGQKLRKLGQNQNIWAITHSAQVASQAHQHICVTKRISDGKTQTHVKLLTDDGRMDELSRLLSGKDITDEARAAAKKLMETHEPAA